MVLGIERITEWMRSNRLRLNPEKTDFLLCAQWRNHARAITGSARVEFISARAVASPENELGVVCISITNQDVFRFKIAM